MGLRRSDRSEIGVMIEGGRESVTSFPDGWSPRRVRVDPLSGPPNGQGVRRDQPFGTSGIGPFRWNEPVLVSRVGG
jgi:hypothetical protein